MKKTLILSMLAVLVGCATTQGTQVDKAAPQYYKLDGAEQDTKISGRLLTPYTEKAGNIQWHRMIEVSFNDSVVVSGYLDANSAQGEVSGKYQDKKVDSVCSSLKTSETNLQVDCIIMIDNKRTVTLRF